MRIAHLVAHAGLNGVATSCHTLIQAQLRAGHDVMLVHRSDSWIERQAFCRDVPLLRTDFETKPKEIRRVGYSVRDWDFDVVHAHGSRANKYGMVFRLAARSPTVMTAHARLLQLPWRFAHRVIAPSQPTADFYLGRGLVSRRSMRVVPHLFDASGVTPVSAASRAAVRAELGIRPDTFLVGSVGEICDRKNQVDMLRILRRLVGMGVDAELLLVGLVNLEEDKAAWAKLAADPDVAPRLHLTGERKDAQRLLHGMDAYLCTSRVEEGPIATLEALAAALPVATVDVGYSSQLIRDGENGRIFPIGAVDGIAEALAVLSRDANLRAEYGRRGRQTVAEQLTAERIIPQVDAVYREAIDVSGIRPRARA